MSQPTQVGGVVLGSPVILGTSSPSLGQPTVLTGTQSAGPVTVGGWQDVDPVSAPSSGGTRPVLEGHGPPPAFIPDSRVGDYYLDVDSGALYRLGGGS
jgi:hypothetical protein